MLLKYSEVDNFIQRKLRNSAPSSNTRLEATKDALQDIYAEYDIDSGVREKVFYIVPDGREFNITDNVADYKKAKELKLLSGNSTQFVDVKDSIFSKHINDGASLNEYSINYNDGNLYMKVNDDYKSIKLHGMNSLTENGTWTVSDDAENLTTDSVTVLEQQYALKFDINVSANYASIVNSTLTPLDLTDYLDLGKIRFWIYLPAVDNFTSVEVKWGSDSANYWSNTATKQLNGSAFVVGWNLVEIDWNGATKTYSPDITDIKFLEVELNYTSSYTDQQSVRVEALNMYLPNAYKLLYYTYYTSVDSSGNLQEDPTATTGDEILLPKRYKSLVGLKACIELAPISFGESADKMIKQFYAEYSNALNQLGLDEGNKPHTQERKLKIQSQW